MPDPPCRIGAWQEDSVETSSAPSVVALRYRNRSYEVVRDEGGGVTVLRCTRAGKVEVRGAVAFAVAARALQRRARRPSNRSRTLRGAARKRELRKRRRGD